MADKSAPPITSPIPTRLPVSVTCLVVGGCSKIALLDEAAITGR